MKELNIARMIIQKRKEKGLTQEALAQFIGVSKASVSKWETGQSYPDILFLPQLAAYFNISIDELLGYAPQMSGEDIRKLYKQLSEEFSTRPFADVWAECQQITKKYYACFPLLFQIAGLYLNHANLAGEDMQAEIWHEVIHLCSRVKEESGDVFLGSQANSIQAMAHLMLGQPETTLELMDGALNRVTDDGAALITQAYQMMGDREKAEEALQVSAYQYLLAFAGTMPSLLVMHAQQPDVFDEILRRALSLAECNQLDTLNANASLQLYLAAAQGYVAQGKPDESLDMLARYVDLCSHALPFSLHGDSFFTHIDAWLEDLPLGTLAPRNDMLIRKSMLEAIQHPLFSAALDGHARYTQLLHTLQQSLGVD